MNIEKLAFVDLETTGISPHYERIIEIGILLWENGKVTKTYKSLVDPEKRINPYITQITSLTDEDLETAPTFHQIAGEISELLEGCTFVAHNVRFDYGFLKAEMERASQTFHMPHFCTAKLSRVLFPQHRHHGLDFIIKRHKIPCENRHRAFDDAEAMCKFFTLQYKRIGKEKLEWTLGQIAKRVSWPQHIPKDEIDALPNCPGVYIFYGEGDTPLYVGKSVNIKTRVISHFTDDLRSTREMKLVQNARKISAVPTAGELGALIKESQLVKRLMPVYNRRLRKSEQLTVIKVQADDEGRMCAAITNSHENEIGLDEIKNIYGVFKTKGQAMSALLRVCEEFKLCKKYLGLEKTSRGCFGHQLKKCSGICVGEEEVGLYNARFDIAFMRLRLKKWPYEHPVKITEQSENISESFILDQWCVFPADENGESMMETERRFDLDIYKILKNYLLNSKNRYNISMLTQG